MMQIDFRDGKVRTIAAPGAVALCLLVGLAGCSGSPDEGRAPESPYAPGWSAVHADGGNTDYSPVEGAADVTLAWERHFEGSVRIGPLPWTINLGPTLDGRGRLYLTSSVAGCHLQALDAATGETLWCSPEVDLLAIASSPVIDRDGRLFLADGKAMHAFDGDGNVLWRTPIKGVPLSAQLTREGRLIFITHIGDIHVLDRESGAAMLPTVELIPGATWIPAAGIFACARGTRDCPSANTPAVDLATGRFFFTFWDPSATQAGVRAMQYSEDPEPRLAFLWENDSLPGGSGSSPDLSADGTRIYVNDNVDSMHAIDAATGQRIWSFAIGWASGGSPSLSPEGLLLPAGGTQSPLLAIQDTGEAAALAWRRDDLMNRGIPTQMAGGKIYATVDAGELRNELLVVDASDGSVLDREPIPGTAVFSVGTTVGLDGTVYVPSIVGGLYAFRPAD